MCASRHAAKVDLCLAERPADAEELPGYESHLAWLGYPLERAEDRAVLDPRRALMDAVDGNAIGGLLIDVFGTEMTAANSTCGTCGTCRPVAELVVYRRAPGTVVRCRTCGSVLMVFVKAHDVTCVDLAGLASLSQPETGLRRAARICR
jgi:hypothetical protein